MSRALVLAPHSLGLCRMLAGMTVVVDLLWRSQALNLHYTDSGIWPVGDLLANRAAPLFPSVYLWAGGTAAVLALFALHGLAGVALALGYRTQMATAICWFFTRSLHARQPTLLNGGDHLFAMLLFWGMFVPWGKAYSLDASGPDRTLEFCEGRVESAQQRLASALFALQLPWLYWVAFFHKLEPVWLRGDAVYYALSSDLFARPVAALLLAHPSWIRALNYGVMGWEAVGPFLLLSPWARGRVGAALMFATMHLGMAVFLRVGLFAWTPCLFLIALLPDRICFRPGLVAIVERLAKTCRLSPGPRHRLAAETMPLLVFLAALSLAQSFAWKDPPLVPGSLRWVETATGLRQDWTMFTHLDRLDDGWLSLQANLPSGARVELLGPDALSRLAPQDRWAGALWKVALDPPRRQPFARAMLRALAPHAVRGRLLFIRRTRDRTSVEETLWQGTP